MEKAKMFEYLEKVAPILPAPIYWLNTDCVVLGANQVCLEAMGASYPEVVVGHTPYEYYPYKFADSIVQHVKQVIRTGATLTQEDIIRDITTGKIRSYIAVRSPIYDVDQKIVGVVGTSVEITAEKESERLRLENLRLENELQKAELEAHQKFRKLVDQLAHDLGSPLMTLSVLSQRCQNVEEKERVMLRNVSSRIRDICGTLLSEYKPKEVYNSDDEQLTELLVSTALEEIVMDKKYEFQHLPIKFDCEYSHGSQFSFIRTDAVAFKRMISNVVNNAVDALTGNAGQVTLKLDVTDSLVKVMIVDNGKGMLQSVIDKIISQHSFTAGKEQGHGIGLMQVHETLQRSNGTLSVDSNLNVGTAITLTFPQVQSPYWILDSICVQPQDIIVILDDDTSIHSAWDFRFTEILNQAPNITIKHFEQATEALNFIHSLTMLEKEHVFLLSDYELLQQRTNGLAVIEESKVKRAALVTSHHADVKIRAEAAKMRIQVLPKQLASVVPIVVAD